MYKWANQFGVTSTRFALGLAWCIALSGCAGSYVTPGRGADMRALGLNPQAMAQMDASIREKLGRSPLAKFPTSLAIVRIQAPGYNSYSLSGWGTGRYSIVTTRDVETDAQFARLERMPQVRGLARMNRLLFRSSEFKSDVELREAAAALHADILLIYTLDTTFYTRDAAVPVSVTTLGLSPNLQAHAITTASGAFIGTHNGYVYGLAEATSRNDRLASAWTSGQAMDDARRKTEADAFDKLAAALGDTWNGIVRQYAANGTN
jgi:hypothetical protein